MRMRVPNRKAKPNSMASSKVSERAVATSVELRERRLDKAFEETFPASDPLAVTLRLDDSCDKPVRTSSHKKVAKARTRDLSANKVVRSSADQPLPKGLADAFRFNW
jgi:hypothetical protein